MSLKTIKIVEDAALSGVRITNSGYLTGEVRAARVGIQTYAGYEFGRDTIDELRLYRPEDEVFQEKSLASYVGRPLTNDHPPEPVNSDNWRDYAVGSIGNKILRDKEFVVVPITLMDGDTVKQVEDGKRELSVGYSVVIDDTPGTTPEGDEYDGVMREISVNHLAIVQRGRANTGGYGNQVRIGDGWASEARRKKQQRRTPPKKEPTTVDLKKITVDGISVETTDQGAEAIQKLQAESKKLAADASKSAIDMKAAADEAKKTHDAAIAAKDAELGKKDAEIKKLQDAQLTDAQVDKLVADRSKLVEHARKFLGDDADLSGKSAADIQSAVVVKLHGADAVADKSPEYIQALFDHAEPPKTNQVHDAMRNRKPVVDSGAAVLDDKGDAIDMDAIYAQQARDMENAHLANFAVGGSQ